MAHDLNIEIPGDPSFAPLAVRLLQELAVLDEGPDKTIIEPLVPVFEQLVARLLTALHDDPAARTLAIGVTLTTDTLALRLRVAANSTGTSAPDVLAPDDPALVAARGVFDSVKVVAGDTEANTGRTLEIHLTVGPRRTAD